MTACQNVPKYGFQGEFLCEELITRNHSEFSTENNTGSPWVTRFQSA